MKMNNMLLTVIIASAFASVATAAIPANAIGARLTSGAEVSYQKAQGYQNRIELDVGWHSTNRYYDHNDDWSALGIAGIYQWDWNITGGLNWFIGPGGSVGIYSGHDSGIGIGIGGQIGLDYNFNTLGAPILLGLDLRPMWGVLSNSGMGGDAGLSIRYTF